MAFFRYNWQATKAKMTANHVSRLAIGGPKHKAKVNTKKKGAGKKNGGAKEGKAPNKKRGHGGRGG